MYARNAARVALFAVVTAAATVSVADAAEGPPPPPKAVNGHAVTVVARGVPTPTTFAFGGGRIFVAGFGDEQNPKATGGVYVLKEGKPVKLPGSPLHVFGLAYSGGTLYVSGGVRSGGIYAWSGWNGTRFAKSRVVIAPRKGFTSFNGIAVGPDGKLYAGVSLGDKKSDDYSKGSTLYANDVVSIDPGSGKISVVATGLRQPWQPIFVPGHDGPLISDLGQENLGKKRPIDRIVEASQGADFGFPSCPGEACHVFRVRQAACGVSGAFLADGAWRARPQALRRAVRRDRQRARGRLDAAVRREVHTSARRLRRARRRARRARRQAVRRRPDRKHLQLHSLATLRTGGGVLTTTPPPPAPEPGPAALVSSRGRAQAA